MSVNINYKTLTNEQKWATLKNGDFIIAEGTPSHPIPKGLYRIFTITPDDEAFKFDVTITLLPLFDGPFPNNMFPYMITDKENLPTIINKVSQVLIDVDVA